MRHLLSLVSILVLFVASEAMSQDYVKKYGSPHFRIRRADTSFAQAAGFTCDGVTMTGQQIVTVNVVPDSLGADTVYVSLSKTDTTGAIRLLPVSSSFPTAVTFRAYGFSTIYIKSTKPGFPVGVMVE